MFIADVTRIILRFAPRCLCAATSQTHETAYAPQHNLWGRAKNSESFWTLEDGELHITLTKLDKAKPWDAALSGHEPLDPLTATEVWSASFISAKPALCKQLTIKSKQFTFRIQRQL